MLFNSFEFIFYFLPIVLFVFYLLKTRRQQLIFLTIASYFFYGFWNYKFTSLLLLSTTIDYTVGQIIENTHNPSKRKLFLLISIISNLGILGFFKYFNFFIGSIVDLSGKAGADITFHPISIILPVGISFYTFQSMSYTIDVYYKRVKPTDSFLTFAAYVSLFPQLVAGPIIRYKEIFDQLSVDAKSAFNITNFSKGLTFFAIGLAKKVLLADRIAANIDPALRNIPLLSTAEAWLSMLGYSLQLYYDFSGYSDMAIGLGLMLNLKINQNFNSPYKSQSIAEFWRRWHISLSSWLKDYLYIPLGGNRNGDFKKFKNMFITMLLGGLWHGAGWVFAIWGIYHGLLLGINNFIRKNFDIPLPKVIKVASTFILVSFGFLIFRSPNIELAIIWIKKLFYSETFLSFENFAAGTSSKFYLAFILGLLIVFFGKNTFEIDMEKFTLTRAVVLGIAMTLCMVLFTKPMPFLYFQF